MARVSFVIKRSSLQEAPQLLQDETTALRSDDYDPSRPPRPPKPPLTGTSDSPYSDGSTLAASVVDYGTVELAWSIQEGVLVATPSAVPRPTEVSIRYSLVGEPRTVQDGSYVTAITLGQERFNFTHRGLPDGRWIYYSLFVKYESTSQPAWYERVVSVKALTPSRYNSIEMLWNAVPEHYRIQDGLFGNNSKFPDGHPLFERGPLYRMLSVFGWELDRVRTLVRYQMIARDPDLANDEVLNALVYELGLPISTVALGTARLRNVVSDIAYLREFKGTIEGTREWITAVTGSDVVIRPIRPNLVPTAASTFGGTLTTTLSGANVPSGSEWVIEGNVSATAVPGGGVTISRTGATAASIVCAKVRIPNASQAAKYLSYVDVTNRNNAQVVGYLLSPTSASVNQVVLTNGSISATPDRFVRQGTHGSLDWYQVPTDLGLPGNGTFTTIPMFLSIFMLFGSGSASLRLNNVGLFTDYQYPYEIDVYTQRLNLFRDPQFNFGTNASTSYWNVSSAASVTVYSSGYTIGASTHANGASVSFITGASTTPFRLGIPYYLSVVDDGDQLKQCAVYSAKYGLLASSNTSIGSLLSSDGTVRKTWELLRVADEIPYLPTNIGDCYVVITGVGNSGETVSISKPLLEPLKAFGEYFDGDGVDEGYVPSLEGITPDYRWGDAGHHRSFSYFTSDYARTIATVNELIDTLLPVTQSENPSVNVVINYDRVYGYTGAGKP